MVIYFCNTVLITFAHKQEHNKSTNTHENYALYQDMDMKIVSCNFKGKGLVSYIVMT